MTLKINYALVSAELRIMNEQPMIYNISANGSANFSGYKVQWGNYINDPDLHWLSGHTIHGAG
jgi:hypothetical protein